MSKPSLCFVAPKAYPALSGRADLLHIGGAEVQQAILARSLALRGYEVTLLSSDFGQNDEEDCERVRVLKIGRSQGPIRGPLPLWSALRRADADIYLQKTAGTETGYAAVWCRWHGRAFIHIVSGDRGCERTLSCLRTRREKVAFRIGLRLADKVITQTEHQTELLRREFGIAAERIPSCREDPLVGGEMPISHAAPARRVLWAGRIDPVKRLELLGDIARCLPDVRFDVAGTGPDSNYVRGVRRSLEVLPNVALHGAVPRAMMHGRFAEASLLLCTSRSEGYPNTFMEAWARGIPTVSTVDPDGVISKHGLGAVAEDPNGLAAAVQSLLGDLRQWQDCSRRARRFFLENHSVPMVVDRFESLFESIRRPSPRRRPNHNPRVATATVESGSIGLDRAQIRA